MTITVKRGQYPDGRKVIMVESPFHPALPERARALGGKWEASKRRWVYDARDAQDVRQLYLAIYGTDGSGSVETVDVEVDAEALECHDLSLWYGGREIAFAFGRDSGARLSEGVRLVRGGFSSGGSRNHPRIICKDETTVIVRDVPRSLVTFSEHVRPVGQAGNGEGTLGTMPDAFRQAFEAEGN